VRGGAGQALEIGVPRRGSRWAEAGLSGGRVCAAMVGSENVTVTVSMALGGTALTERRDFCLADFTADGKFQPRAFAARVRAELIEELPALKEVLDGLERLPAAVAAGDAGASEAGDAGASEAGEDGEEDGEEAEEAEEAEGGEESQEGKGEGWVRDS